MDERLKSKIENWKRLQRKSGGNPGTLKLFNEMYEEIISQAEKAQELETSLYKMAEACSKRGTELRGENKQYKEVLKETKTILDEAISSLDNNEKVNGLEYAVENIKNSLKGALK